MILPPFVITLKPQLFLRFSYDYSRLMAILSLINVPALISS